MSDESTSSAAPLLPSAPEQLVPTGAIEARLICIFDRAYEIQNNENLQTELAKLIYLKHVKNVFVDSDSTITNGPTFITETAGIHTEKQGAAKYIYGEILKTDGLLPTYLETGDKGVTNAVKLYIAPTYVALQTLVANATGTATATLENIPNSVYMLCRNDQSVLLQLIKVLQRMGFNNNYIKDGIHMQAKQVNPILGNAIARMIPDINKLQSGVPGGDGGDSSRRLRSTSQPINPLVHASQIMMTITSVTDTPTGRNTILLVPAITINATSPQYLSILNFLGIKPDTTSEFKNMAKNRAPAKTDASNHNSDAITALGSAVPKLYQENIEKAIPPVKTSLEGYKTALKEYVSKFEKFEKEYKSGSGEKARIFKKYIAGIFGERKKGKNENAEGFKIMDLYKQLIKDQIHEYGTYEIKTNDTDTYNNNLADLIYYSISAYNKQMLNNIPKNARLLYFPQLIKHFTYGGDDDAEKLNFNESVYNNTLKHNKKFKENEKYIANTKDFFDRTRDLAYILEYINGYSYYKRNIYNLNHFIRYYNEQHIDLKARKTLKKLPSPKSQRGPYPEIQVVQKTTKENQQLNEDTLRTKLEEQKKAKADLKTQIEPEKIPFHKRFFGETKKKYKQARQLSANIKNIDNQLSRLKSPQAPF